MLFSIAAIFIGAGLGALLRWSLSLALNLVLPHLPLGTLASNLIGGYLIGVAIVVFNTKAGLPPEWRLFVITGFMGGLTTFSTYSAEVVQHVVDGRLGWAATVAFVHLIGSFTLTLLGILTARALLLAA
ncbi:fluoride efflux transporter CrcB [Burkholderia glumae]|uniref:Fluoride-specific ion channel FluC n=1 Tax=Burkholderia glumae TaxID=337 RepID=A0AAP9Y503_BURGL|nr:fluoride efflux transporter CrcB [Burkholderia glumae]ACR27970.1 camphor resistance protein CrcB [Burkholderia glumae BGR1]AJY67632.1 crcB-like family protein [Burkholderia glumae LMG 2196 = ATCC 33617]KHJ60464.1 camphor resistance protein CrcB [Burkholderia glumae]MCM2481050.1 fluoride efflux transporter CrcB [Burkholderia glumae]MCM2508811.1 fluoride efflux transporter CrcB [Burkholderia glumae]